MTNYDIRNYSELKLNKEDVLALLNKDGEILKNDNRSYVKRVELNDIAVIIKQPKEKNRRKWQRILSLFIDSEVVHILKAMQQLLDAGVETNHPICSLEIRKFGFVVDSYAVYEYLEGKRVNEEDAKGVIKLIKKIHSLGYVHGDTQVRNFLNIDGKIVTIDSNLHRKKLGKISEYLEYINFEKNIPEAHKFIDYQTPWYGLSAVVFYSKVVIRRTKKKIRKKLRKKK